MSNVIVLIVGGVVGGFLYGLIKDIVINEIQRRRRKQKIIEYVDEILSKKP